MSKFEITVEYDIEAVVATTRASVLYKKARVIGELNVLDIRTGLNNLDVLQDIIREVAVAKKEEQFSFWNCSDVTWAEAGERFIAEYGD